MQHTVPDKGSADVSMVAGCLSYIEFDMLSDNCMCGILIGSWK